MDKDGSEDKPRIDYYPKIRLDAKKDHLIYVYREEG